MSAAARLLFTAVFLLVGFGVVMTYSASAIYADHIYGDPHHFFIRQIFFVILGTIGLFVTSSVPLTFWKKHARSLMLLAIALLLAVLLPAIGYSAGGARRWINLGVFKFQPAEFAKLAACIYLADYLSRKMKFIKKGSLKVFFPPLLLVAVTCGLSLIQPDLGSCAFLFLIAAVLVFMAGIQMRYVIATIIMFMPALYFLIIRVPYRLSRVTAYLNPWQDPQGSGFQMIQSFLAFGLGGFGGVGLGQSTQKLFYLPSSYNDFIFSVIGEELGLVGVMFVIILYAMIFLAGIQMADKSNQDFERLLIVSLTLLIVFQALVNMMVATGLIPTKGLPLPFVSYGGTSMVINMMSIGILLGIDRHARSRRWK